MLISMLTIAWSSGPLLPFSMWSSDWKKKKGLEMLKPPGRIKTTENKQKNMPPPLCCSLVVRAERFTGHPLFLSLSLSPLFDPPSFSLSLSPGSLPPPRDFISWSGRLWVRANGRGEGGREVKCNVPRLRLRKDHEHDDLKVWASSRGGAETPGQASAAAANIRITLRWFVLWKKHTYTPQIFYWWQVASVPVHLFVHLSHLFAICCGFVNLIVKLGGEPQGGAGEWQSSFRDEHKDKNQGRITKWFRDLLKLFSKWGATCLWSVPTGRPL